MQIRKIVRSTLFQRYTALWRFSGALCLALITALFLFQPVVEGNFSAPLIALGLDPLRATLITALLLAATTALVSAIICRQRLAAIIGAGIACGIGYVLPFVHQEQLPVFDPGGHLESLNVSALQHAAIAMVASSLLSAFMGAAIGNALGEVLLDPIRALVLLIWHTLIRPAHIDKELATVSEGQKSGRLRLYLAWIGLLAMLVLFMLSNGIGDLLAFSPDVGLHNPPAAPTHGTLIADSMVSPAFQGQHRSFLVYLPPSYNDPAAQDRRYTTLYLLHGSPGSEYDWTKGGKAVQSADTLISLGEASEVIMIFPDGNGRKGETSEWGNSADHKQLMENFVALDLVKYIDQKYRTIPTATSRAIAGLSMGGFGAMNIAVHHPDIFGSVIALGGYYRAEGSIWGHNTAYLQANSPAYTLPAKPEAWKLHVFLGAATRDQPYYRDTQQFIQILKELHIPYTFDLENGYHAWSIWEIQLYHALIWLKAG